MMSAKRVTQALILGLALPILAAAQSAGAWRSAGASDGYYGLQPGRAAASSSCGSVANACALNIPLLEKAAAGIDWRLVGRLGAAPSRPLRPGLGGWGMDGGEGLAYGVGLSWDLSPNASATVGFESYDYRFGGGDRDAVRATSLGLQWRY